MKYYEIEHIDSANNGIIMTTTLCIVENKEVAEHWCKIHKNYIYHELDTEVEEC